MQNLLELTRVIRRKNVNLHPATFDGLFGPADVWGKASQSTAFERHQIMNQAEVVFDTLEVHLCAVTNTEKIMTSRENPFGLLNGSDRDGRQENVPLNDHVVQ